MEAAARNLISKVQKLFLAADKGWTIFFVFWQIVAYQWHSVVTDGQFCFNILYREVQYFLFVYLIFLKNGKAAIQTTSGGGLF